MTQKPAIYLDNAATTRVADPVATVIADCMADDFGNPSSAHHKGIAAERRIKAAREVLLETIGDRGGSAGDVVWTSGGTEGDALGVIGAARAHARRGKHVLTSAIEHPAVSASAAQLGAEGWRSSSIPVTSDGVIDVDTALSMVTDETTVVAVMLVNNEIGTLLPVAELARAVHERRADIHVHCDAVQALGKLTVDVNALGADSVAFAAHKLHGPKGVGALWLRKSARLAPLWSGGGQQAGLRSGTLNVPGIAGMGEAVRLSRDGMADRSARWATFADTLRDAARACGVDVRENGGDAPRSAHIVSLAFRGVPAEPLLHVLESRGVLVSAGSACSERSRKPSPVLTAIGADKDYGTIRFSFGRDTTAEDVRNACQVLIDAVNDFK
jgi:cysteine desulfurase